MVDKLTPIIQIASENPELAPVVGIAYRGYQIATGLAAIEEKLREDQRLEQNRINVENSYAGYTPPQGWASIGGFIASRPRGGAPTTPSRGGAPSTPSYSTSGTFIASRPRGDAPSTPSYSPEDNEVKGAQQEGVGGAVPLEGVGGDVPLDAFDEIYRRVTDRMENLKRMADERDQAIRDADQKAEDRQLAQEELERQNAELIQIANESKYRDQGPLYLDEEADLYRQFAEEERLAQIEDAKRRQRVPMIPIGNTTEEKLDFYRNQIAAITARGDIALDDADLSDTPFNIANPAGPRNSSRFRNGVGYTPLLVGGLAMAGGYLNRSINEPNPFTPPNLQNPTFTLPPAGVNPLQPPAGVNPLQPPFAPNPGSAAAGVPTVSNPIINPTGVVSNPIINPVVSITPIDPVLNADPLVIVKENFVPRTISVAPTLAIGLAVGAGLTTLLSLLGGKTPSNPRNKRKHPI